MYQSKFKEHQEAYHEAESVHLQHTPRQTATEGSNEETGFSHDKTRIPILDCSPVPSPGQSLQEKCSPAVGVGSAPVDIAMSRMSGFAIPDSGQICSCPEEWGLDGRQGHEILQNCSGCCHSFEVEPVLLSRWIEPWEDELANDTLSKLCAIWRP